ncbi:MATE family efflux transporter [uncultured Subdoligranulum sp.]|uniref:MATE family efflux transporter n=1 Tax=uncultured Subdoligranulum sp. TaxID=512298 RepID=UPI0025DF6ACB|nr:MATE family efflux transporter [uncultured Subdoligranulum sp.]
MRTVKQTDILTGSIPRQLLVFFLPIWFGTLFQQLYNTADTLIVGNFVGTNALAAVGATGAFVNLLVGLFVGLCSGAGVVVAQSYGAKDLNAVDRQVHTALVFSVAIGALLTVLGLLSAEPVLRLMGTPQEILGDAALYLRIYFLGMIPQILYNMGTNILRAAGDSKRPLYFLIVASLVNIVLDVVFIAGFHWGVAGAALATVLSQIASAVLTLRCLAGSQGMPWHLSAAKLRMERTILTAICMIGIPAAAQSALYNVSNMMIQSCMNGFGTNTIAAWGVYGKIDFIFWMTINSLGIAITTFAGQNFGARQYDRVHRGIRICLGMAAGITVAISVVFYLAAEPLFQLFSQDPEVITVGVEMMHVLVPAYVTYVCIEIFSGALRGCGDVRVPTLITVVGVCGLRILWLVLAVPVWHSVATVELSYPITWVLASLLFIVYYKRGHWLQRCIAARHGA